MLPTSDPACPAAHLSDEQFEALALAYFGRRVPKLEEVRLTAVSGGEAVRFILLRPGEAAVTLDRPSV